MGVRAHVPRDAVAELFASERGDDGDAARDVEALVDQLPEKQQAAIRLMKIEQHSIRDAAAASGVSETSIKVNIHRGMRRLVSFQTRTERR